jgi:hypothetical protein
VRDVEDVLGQNDVLALQLAGRTMEAELLQIQNRFARMIADAEDKGNERLANALRQQQELEERRVLNKPLIQAGGQDVTGTGLYGVPLGPRGDTATRASEKQTVVVEGKDRQDSILKSMDESLKAIQRTLQTTEGLR